MGKLKGKIDEGFLKGFPPFKQPEKVTWAFLAKNITSGSPSKSFFALKEERNEDLPSITPDHKIQKELVKWLSECLETAEKFRKTRRRMFLQLKSGTSTQESVKKRVIKKRKTGVQSPEQRSFVVEIEDENERLKKGRTGKSADSFGFGKLQESIKQRIQKHGKDVYQRKKKELRRMDTQEETASPRRGMRAQLKKRKTEVRFTRNPFSTPEKPNEQPAILPQNNESLDQNEESEILRQNPRIISKEDYFDRVYCAPRFSRVLSLLDSFRNPKGVQMSSEKHAPSLPSITKATFKSGFFRLVSENSSPVASSKLLSVCSMASLRKDHPKETKTISSFTGGIGKRNKSLGVLVGLPEINLRSKGTDAVANDKGKLDTKPKGKKSSSFAGESKHQQIYMHVDKSSRTSKPKTMKKPKNS